MEHYPTAFKTNVIALTGQPIMFVLAMNAWSSPCQVKLEAGNAEFLCGEGESSTRM